MELYNILIFSDSREWRKNLSMRLMKREFTCQDTGSMEEALNLIQMAEEIQTPFAVCLLDWDGGEDVSRFWNKLNRDHRYEKLLIVLLASEVDREVLEIAFQRRLSEVYGKNVMDLMPYRLLKLIHFHQETYCHSEEGECLNQPPGVLPRETLLSNVDHEFRTLMNSLLGMVNMLKSDALPEEQKEYVEIIEKSSVSLSNIFYDVIDYSRLEAGQLNLKSALFNIEHAIQSVIDLFTVRAQAQDIELSLNFEPKNICLVAGDYEKIRQVFYNLISNAVKYTMQGNVIVNVSCHPKEDDLYDFRFEILDTGVGLNDDKQDWMNHFFATPNTDWPNNEAEIGLGLYITKQLLELMGGALHVISQQGEGTTFWFNLTLRGQSDRRKASQVPASLHRIPTRREDQAFLMKEEKARQYKILIVEDDIVNQKVISLLVKKAGYKFDIVSNGVDAISKLSRMAFDLVLMDIQMAGMDGFETTEMIRDSTSKVLDNDLPVIAMTAYATEEHRLRSRAVGMNDLILKPIDELELSILLHSYLVQADFSQAPLDHTLQHIAKGQALKGPRKNACHLNKDTILAMYHEFGQETLDLLEMFKVEFKEKYEKIKTAVETNNPLVLKEVAHSLKTNSATFGANELFDICLQFEILGRNNSCEGARELLLELEEEGEHVLEELEKIDFKTSG